MRAMIVETYQKLVESVESTERYSIRKFQKKEVNQSEKVEKQDHRFEL